MGIPVGNGQNIIRRGLHVECYKSKTPELEDRKKVISCICLDIWTLIQYYHFPNSVTLRFSEQAKIFTRRCPNRQWLDLQNLWNLHIKQKANQYTDQSYSECVWCVFLQDFTKHMDSKIAPKTQAYAILHEECLHVTLHFQIEFFMHCLLNWSVYFVYYKTVLDTHQMWLVIVLFGLCLIC